MRVHGRLFDLWGAESPGVNAVAWLCHPSGHAAAAIQLIPAVLQHISVLAQHVLPNLWQPLPQQAEGLLKALQKTTRVARALGGTILAGVLQAHARQQQLRQQQDSKGGRLQQQLLSSPYLLPCATALAVLAAADVSHAVAAGNGQAGSSSSDDHRDEEQEQMQQGALYGSHSHSRSSTFDSAAPTACQLQLLHLIGVAPELTAWDDGCWVASAVCQPVLVAVGVCFNWCRATVQSLHTSGMGTRASPQQWWQFEQLCLLLLPTVLLPCASSLLSPSAQKLGQRGHQQALLAVQHLLHFSNTALSVDSELQLQLLSLGRRCTPISAAWVQEMLDGVLQLADQLLYQQQPPTATATVAAAHPAATAQGSRGNSSSPCALAKARARCHAQLLSLLESVLHYSHIGRLSEPNSGSSSSSATQTTAAVSPEAARFVKLGGVVEAVLRAVTTAVMSSMLSIDDLPVDRRCVLTEILLCHHVNTKSMLVQHMGFCGPVALAQEQRQLYSLLSTVLKLGHGETAGGKPCWGEQAVGSCCLAAGQAAVRLLLPPPPPKGSAAAVAAQQPATDYLPSLVIFGRCCLQWAEQLQQKTPQLLLLASGLLQQEQRHALLHDHSAGLVCVPAVRQAVPFTPADTLENLIAAVTGWLGNRELPSAADSAPGQLQQQQLDALLLAQQGTQQGLTEASLTALAQQLRATGVMFCSIAVPHFCNNPACGSISGPTEVQLVSGRSCICAGCRTARYCGRDCQQAAWKQHKPVCKALATRAAATAES
jgi:hypothetical protein